MAAIPRMLTIQETAKETGLTYECLRKKCINKEIVHIRSGRKYLINLDKLIDHMNGEEKDHDKERDAEGD